jgi:hypothetical protein
MYIDPSSGGMLFQVIAVIFGLISGMVLLFSNQIKSAYRRLLRYFRERSTMKSEASKVSQPKDQNSVL